MLLVDMSRLMTKPTKWLCAQRRLRSAWASTQSDQSLRCALNRQLRTLAFFMRTAKTLIRLGWSESSLGTQPYCWFCHEAAHISLKINWNAFLLLYTVFWSMSMWNASYLEIIFKNFWGGGGATFLKRDFFPRPGKLFSLSCFTWPSLS